MDCVNCGQTVRLTRVWPSGTMKWVDPMATVCGAFCPDAEGRPHEPSALALEVEQFLASNPA